MLATLFTSLLFVAAASAAFIDIPPALVDRFWFIIDKDAGNLVSRLRLEDFFLRYDENITNPYLYVNETQFLTGAENWPNDFNLLNLTQEEAHANFGGLDRFKGSIDTYRVISFGDLNLHIDAGDSDDDDSLNETEFKAAYNSLLHSMHFGVMFNRYDTDDDSYITKTEFEFLYSEMNDPANPNGAEELSRTEMVTFFLNGTYTGEPDAEQFFDNLLASGYSTNGVTINKYTDWSNLFTDLDTITPQSYLEFHGEFEKLDHIMHGNETTRRIISLINHRSSIQV